MTPLAQTDQAFAFANKSADYGPAGVLVILLAVAVGLYAWYFLRPRHIQQLALEKAEAEAEERRKDADLDARQKVADSLVRLVDLHEETRDAVVAIRDGQDEQQRTNAALIAGMRHQTEAWKKLNEKSGGKLGVAEDIGGMQEALHSVGDDTAMQHPVVPPPPGSNRTRRP